MSATSPAARTDQALEVHRGVLWQLCYRMTGSPADADDIVQETFARALANPPANAELPLLPWLVRVALNLARDVLRRRRRQSYVGPWLPVPVALELTLAEASTDGRYDLLESASFAFLIALEALTPLQRAILLLRDVFDYSVRETASALALKEGAVKTAHHRARRAMSNYDVRRCRPSPELTQRTEQALRALMAGVVSGDVASVEALLSHDVRAITDAGGEFLAALRPVLGASKVARFFTGVAAHAGPVRTEPRRVNGLPALLIELSEPKPRAAARLALLVDVGADGKLREIHVISASAKLRALFGQTEHGRPGVLAPLMRA